jgi:ATP-dependent protease ClpP protease subunit
MRAVTPTAPTRTAERVTWARKAATRRGKDRNWYRVENRAKDDDSTTVWVYEEIGGWCGLDAAQFVKDLDAIDTPRIELRINSPGGSVFDGVAIYNNLVAHPAQVDVHVDGMAASIASVIAMAGDTITMGHGSQMMIHDGWGLCVGNAADMRVLADLLDKCSDDIAGFYARRAGGPVSEWRDTMRLETWYTDEEAVAAGLADKTAPKRDDAPGDLLSASWDLSVFAYAGREHAPPPRTVSVVPEQPPIDFDVSVFRGAFAGVRPPAPRASFDPAVFRGALRSTR